MSNIHSNSALQSPSSNRSLKANDAQNESNGNGATGYFAVEEFENLTVTINEAKCNNLYAVDDIDGFPSSAEKVMENLDIDKHRWYEISTTVYKLGEWFFGVCGPSQLYSESGDWESLCKLVEAFEMKEVSTVTYEGI